MSKPKDHDKVKTKFFFRDDKLTLYTVKIDGKVSKFIVEHLAGKKLVTKEFPVANHKVLKAFKELEQYTSKII